MNDFSMNLSPSTLSVAPGGANATTVNTAVVSGTAESVSLTVSGAPAGVTASLASNVVTAGASTTLNVTVASTATPGSYSLTVTGTSPSITHSAVLSLTITSAGGTGIVNGGFESGALSPWTASGTVAVGGPAHTGSYSAVLGSTSPTKGDSSITQTFVAGGPTLSFFYNVTCPDKVRHDWATVTLKDVTTGATRTLLTKTCTLGAGWKMVSSSLTAGHKYTLTLVSHDDDTPGDPTYTLYDDVVAA
jgi:hypothetical protein